MTKRSKPPAPSFFAAPQLPLPVAQPFYAPAPYQLPDEAAQPARNVPAVLDVRVTVSVDRDAAVAKAELNEGGHPYAVPLARATGAAVRQRQDTHDPETATLLASARALRKLANKMDKAARARIKSADSTRRDRDRSKARRQPQEGKNVISVLTGGALADGTVVVDAAEGDLPDGLKDLVRGLFPARDIQFIGEDTVSVPERIEHFLADHGSGGVHRERPEPRHAKPGDRGSDV